MSKDDHDTANGSQIPGPDLGFAKARKRFEKPQTPLKRKKKREPGISPSSRFNGISSKRYSAS